MRLFLVALVAIMSLATIAEAAPKKAVRHRTKHSTRVSSSVSTPTPETPAKKPAGKKPAPTHKPDPSSTRTNRRQTTKPK